MKKPIDRVAAFDGLFVVRPAWAESEEALMKPAGVDAIIAKFFFYSQGNTTDSSCLPLIILKSFSAATVPIFSLGWG